MTAFLLWKYGKGSGKQNSKLTESLKLQQSRYRFFIFISLYSMAGVIPKRKRPLNVPYFRALLLWGCVSGVCWTMLLFFYIINIVPWKLDELRMFMKENTFVSLILIYMVSVGCVGPERSHQTRYSFIYTWLVCCFEEVFVVCRIIYDHPLLSPCIISAFYRLRTFSSCKLKLGS